MPRCAALLAFAVAHLLGLAARAEPDWQPLTTQDGVAVEQRSAGERAIPELRGTVEIDAGLYEVLAVIGDVSRQSEWMHDCVESRLLRRESDTALLLYNRTTAPWPVSDRDVVLRSETLLVAPPERVAVRFANTEDPSAPPVEGVVRMPRLVGAYDLTALAPALTRVVYTVDFDPGGSIPDWVAARTARESPLETLIGLRRQVGTTRGGYTEFVNRWRSRR